MINWRHFLRRDGANPDGAPKLDLATLPWLMATAAMTLLPHFDALPPWLSTGSAVVMAWRAWLWRRGQLSGHKFVVLLLALSGTAGIAFEYRTIFGREAGVALLVLLMSLKLMELHRRRDAVVVVMLGYFLLLTHYFYADSIPVGAWMLLAMTVATATLIRLQAPSAGKPIETLRRAAVLIAQAVPIMAVLFILFPRINGPLWGLPQDSRKASTGLSDEMSPGSISQLSQSSALAFRAEFRGTPPARDLLYWRGPVMTNFDGRSWRVARTGNIAVPSIAPLSPSGTEAAKDNSNATISEYTLTIEPHQQRWLLALDLPIRVPNDAFITPSLSVVNRNPVRDRLRVEFASTTRYRAGVEESPEQLKRALQIPAELNPRSRALAIEWRAQSDNPSVIAAKALQLFQRDNFVYTLTPPLLGQHSIDDFLFGAKRGFCEHYASSFAFLMRAAGIPARVVGGYLGGEFNPVDGHLAVRQLDAHAWVEIWIAGEGWRRIDPTASVAPNRVEQGLQASLPADETLPALLRPEVDWLRTLRYRWDAIDYAWNRWVLGYDAERQRQILSGFGVSNDWRTLVSLLATLGGLLVLGLALWITRRQPQHDRVQALWQIACNALAARGLPRTANEGPADYAKRISRQATDLGDLVNTIATHYIHLRYAASTVSPASSKSGKIEFKAFYTAVGLIAPRWKLWSFRLWNLARH